jgi:hypothetical protein
MSEVPESWKVIAAWVLLLVPLLPLSVAAMLAPDALHRNLLYRERVGIAIRDALLAGMIALLAANFLWDWQLDPVLLFIVIVLAYLSISIPSGIWLYLYLTDRFR